MKDRWSDSPARRKIEDFRAYNCNDGSKWLRRCAAGPLTVRQLPQLNFQSNINVRSISLIIEYEGK